MAGYKNFNFVLFLPFKGDFAEFAFHDAFALNNFRVIIPTFVDSGSSVDLSFAPYRPSNNPQAFKNPSAFNPNSPQFFYNDFPTLAPIVFIFFPHKFNHFEAAGFFRLLRRNYPDCKLVLFMTDPVLHFQQRFGMFLDRANSEKIISTFDCVLTYLIKDATDYGLTYFEGSQSIFPYEQPAETPTDIFFVGFAKDRLEKILRAYEAFKSAGFVCDFYINGVRKPPKIEANDLHFNVFLNYDKAMEHILRSRAILDITRSQNYGLTVRYFQSLSYNKNFITDNAFYRQERFTSPKLFLIDRSLELDKEKFMDAAKFSSNYRNEYSPYRLVDFLESILNV